jgi:hypothetical protein
VNDFFKEDILTVRREDFHNIDFWREFTFRIFAGGVG